MVIRCLIRALVVPLIILALFWDAKNSVALNSSLPIYERSQIERLSIDIDLSNYKSQNLPHDCSDIHKHFTTVSSSSNNRKSEKYSKLTGIVFAFKPPNLYTVKYHSFHKIFEYFQLEKISVLSRTMRFRN